MRLMRTAARREHILKVLAEIQTLKDTKRDYIYPANLLKADGHGGLILGGRDTFRVGTTVYTEWRDAEKALDALQKAGTEARIEPLGRGGILPMSRTALGQVCARTGMPLRYYDFLMEGEHHDLAAHNLSTLLSRSGGRLLLRTLRGRVRAVLSDSYKILDHADVFLAAAEAFAAAGAEVWHARLWDDGFELFAVAERIAGEVASSGSYQGQAHGWWRQGGDGGDDTRGGFAAGEAPLGDRDTHYAACRVSNSETGKGGLNVTPCVLRALCNNTSVVGKTLGTVHLGRRRGEEGLVYADDTRAAEAQTALLKLRDTVRTVFDADAFRRYLERLNLLTGEKIRHPESTAEAVAGHFGFTEERRQEILANLFRSNDLTRYGLVQATTYAAHAADAAGRAEEASRLEEAGGQLALLGARDWAALAGV